MSFKSFNSLACLIIILLTTLYISSCGNSKEENNESLKWMSETSGIQIPDSIQNLNIYNNHEWGIIAKFKLSM